MLLLKSALAVKGAMLGAAFVKGVVLGGAGATATAVAIVAAGCAARRCGKRREPPAPAAPSATTGAA